jgi:hypothetical protein
MVYMSKCITEIFLLFYGFENLLSDDVNGTLQCSQTNDNEVKKWYFENYMGLVTYS